MIAYIDASVLFSLFLPDVHAPRAAAWMDGDPDYAISAWAVAEFSSAVAQRVRSDRLTHADAARAEGRLDEWLQGAGPILGLDAQDILTCRRLCQRSDLALRTPDALHLALTRRVGCALATFDDGMARAARLIGVEVVDL